MIYDILFLGYQCIYLWYSSVSKGFYNSLPTKVNQYQSYGVGCSIVEIDTLTGEYKVNIIIHIY